MDSLSYVSLGPESFGTPGSDPWKCRGIIGGKDRAIGRVLPQKCGENPLLAYYTARVR